MVNKAMKKSLITLAFLLFSAVANASCPATAEMGEPILREHNQQGGLYSLCRLGYHALYNQYTKTSVWVAEVVRRENIKKGKDNREDSFIQDPDLPDYARPPKLSDYYRSGYSRGHLAAYSNFSANPEMAKQSFFLTNVVPQVQRCNNSGVWSRIERMVRDWAVHYGELYVVTGPIYNTHGTKFIGSGVEVPTYLYKVIYNPVLNQSVGFIVPNAELCEYSPRHFLVKQHEIEANTGLIFFPNFSGYWISDELWQ